jgi:hypothetical protein
VGLLCTQGRLQARDVTGEQGGPHGCHVVFMFSKVDNDDRASGFAPGEHSLGQSAYILVELGECLSVDGGVVSGGRDEAEFMVGIL